MAVIYLRHGETYVAMTETPYESESVLQALLAQHPEMLADEDAGEGSLLLIRREAAVSDSLESGGRWSLDHLYVDAKGVPTLVEVKRSSDTRGRREVVAQMLDYAANAKTSFNAERMAAWLEEDAQRRGCAAADVLLDAFGVQDPDVFWQAVTTNLDAERFRLIFVSDVIAPELRRIIEFLNGQMTQTDVLAIEVKQYTDAAGERQTIVPRVIGDTTAARVTKKTLRRSPLDRDRLLASAHEVSADAAAAAAALLDWAEQHPLLEVRWARRAGDIGLPGATHGLLRLWDDGSLEVRLETLREIDSAWDEPERIQQLIEEFEAIDGVRLRSRKWPKTPLAPLADPHARQRFTAVVDDVVRMLNIAG